MRVKILVTAALAASVISSLPAFGQDGGSGIYREALNLYSSGMYERARTMFESLPGNDMAEGYAVLCALKLNSVDAADVYSDYASRHGRATLLPQMHYERALTLFDAQDYPGAAAEFAKVDAKAVSAMNSAEALFKRGYCAFAAGDHATARSFFGKVDSMPMSAFTSAACYLNGYMDYTESRFVQAEPWFFLPGGLRVQPQELRLRARQGSGPFRERAGGAQAAPRAHDFRVLPRQGGQGQRPEVL